MPGWRRPVRERPPSKRSSAWSRSQAGLQASLRRADTCPMNHASRRLGEFLVERRVLSRDDLEAMLADEAKAGTPLPRLLASHGLGSGKDLMAAVAHQVGIRFVDLAETAVDPRLDRLVPAELAHAGPALAVEADGDHLVVAMGDPGDKQTVAAIAEATGWAVTPAIAERAELRRAVDGMYGSAAGNAGRAEPGDEIEISIDEPPPLPLDEPAVAGRLGDESSAGDLHVDDLLERLLDLGGSDLHLTAGAHPSVRVHGELKPMTEFPIMNGSEIRRMI